jgi:hypothetical protein
MFQHKISSGRWRFEASHAQNFGVGIRNLRHLTLNTYPDRAVRVLDIVQIIDAEERSVQNVVAMEEGTVTMHGHIEPRAYPWAYTVTFDRVEVCKWSGNCESKPVFSKTDVDIIFQCHAKKLVKSPGGLTLMTKET